MTTLTTSEAADLARDPLDHHGLPLVPCAAVRLDGPVPARDAEAITRLARSQVVVGLVRGPVDPDLVAALTVSLGPSSLTTVDAPIAPIAELVAANPRAATALVQLLRITEVVPAYEGVVAESLAYSMLLGGPEHAAWRAATPRRAVPDMHEDAVVVDRAGPIVTLTLNRPQRHNAFCAALRDGLVDALALAEDPTVKRIVLRGAGPSFSSGGDLDEFGTASDLAAAHVVRVCRSAGLAVDAVRARVDARLHGACIGAGIEVPAFANRVVAAPGTRIRLPELGMGLVPGAGGTVSVTRRIGRWRTAWMVLSGADLDADTAYAWGLVDAVS
jgi:hypothetical protein